MHEIADLIRYGRFTATHPTSRHSLFRQQSNYPAKICDRRVMKQAALLQVGLESASVGGGDPTPLNPMGFDVNG